MAQSPTLYLVAAESARRWFTHFADYVPGDEVIFTSPPANVDLDAILRILERRPETTVVLYSEHETLERDCWLADFLRAHGHRAYAQSPRAVVLGKDKFRMKEFFDRHDFASPRWGRGGDLGPAGAPEAPVVVKRICGTQSRGTRLVRLADAQLRWDELWELYVDGVEYSVVVYRDESREVVFPPVWKGATRTDLTPPWRRLRLCPDPAWHPGREQAMRLSAREIARAVDAWGPIEIEYIVTAAGDVLALEINPRIAGTTRIAAMAAGLPIFSLHRLPALAGDVPAVRCAGEVPYSGPPIIDAEDGVFATSRLTASGSSFSAVRRKLTRGLAAAGLGEPAEVAAVFAPERRGARAA